MPPPEQSPWRAHWEDIYEERDAAEFSWQQAEPTLSLRLIQQFAPTRETRIIDVGAGTSPLAGRLLDLGYESVTVLDISQAALSALRGRLAEKVDRVRFVVGILLELGPLGRFDLWHDRAVFHFLTSPADRRRYAALAEQSLSPGGFLIMATFAPDGPERCSGLPVCRYEALGLAQSLGAAFALVASEREVHLTQSGLPQSFTYAVLRRVSREPSGNEKDRSN